MANFINYEENIINMSLIRYIYTRDLEEPHEFTNSYFIYFEYSADEKESWDFETKEERDSVYDYIFNKFIHNIDISGKESNKWNN